MRRKIPQQAIQRGVYRRENRLFVWSVRPHFNDVEAMVFRYDPFPEHMVSSLRTKRVPGLTQNYRRNRRAKEQAQVQGRATEARRALQTSELWQLSCLVMTVALHDPQVSPQLPSRHILCLECCLWVAGLTALGYSGFKLGEAEFAQIEGNRILDRVLPGATEQMPTDQGKPPDEGALVGRIVIPAVKLSGVIFEGSSNETLAEGVGHLSTSPLPGHTGNVVLAGHRDSYFRPLRKIRPGERIDVTTRAGLNRYKVTSTQVVGPRDIQVLAYVPGTDLTLITCYPFESIGAAPDRFIVRARAVP
jgi:sortase A